MGLTDWRGLSSKGVIADTPAGCIQYRIAEEWHAYLSQSDAMADIGVLLGMMGGAFAGVTDFVSAPVADRWIIRARNADGVQMFRQQVETEVQVTAMVTGIAGMTMLGLFTWYVNRSTQFTTHFGLDDIPEPHGTYAHGPLAEYEGVACNGECDEFCTRFWQEKFAARFKTVQIVEDGRTVTVPWWRDDSLWQQIDARPEGSVWIPYEPGKVPQPWDMMFLRNQAAGWYHAAIVHGANQDGIEIAHSNENNDGKGKFSDTTGYEIIGWLRWSLPVPHEMVRTTLARACTATGDVLEVDNAGALPDSGTVYVGIAQDDWWKGTPDRVDYTGRDLTTTPHKLIGCSHGRLGCIARANAAGAIVIEAPAIKMLSDTSYYDPAGGGDYTNQYGLVLFDWYSPIYQLNMPSGSYIEFAGHYIGRADLPSNLDIVQTRVCAGPTWSAIFIPETGYWWTADTAGTLGIDVRVAHDVRALGASAQVATADPVSARDWPITAAEVIRAQAWTALVGSGSNGLPIWVRWQWSLHPLLIWTCRDCGWGRRFGAIDTTGDIDVQITDKPVVAAAYDPSGNLVCICCRRGRMSVVVSGLSPSDRGFIYGDLPTFTPPPEITPTFWENGEQTTFPALAETIHFLAIPRPGHLKLLTADGHYYESTDGGYNWR